MFGAFFIRLYTNLTYLSRTCSCRPMLFCASIIVLGDRLFCPPFTTTHPEQLSSKKVQWFWLYYVCVPFCFVYLSILPLSISLSRYLSLYLAPACTGGMRFAVFHIHHITSALVHFVLCLCIPVIISPTPPRALCVDNRIKIQSQQCYTYKCITKLYVAPYGVKERETSLMRDNNSAVKSPAILSVSLFTGCSLGSSPL